MYLLNCLTSISVTGQIHAYNRFGQQSGLAVRSCADVIIGIDVFSDIGKFTSMPRQVGTTTQKVLLVQESPKMADKS